MKVGLFIPCYINAVYPGVGRASYELLSRLGCEVDYPLGQTCCGQPMANAGFEKDARALAARAKELLQTRRPPAGEVLWLRAQGYSFAEIAQRCGVSESAARTLDFRTRHWLREQLQKEGAEL